MLPVCPGAGLRNFLEEGVTGLASEGEIRADEKAKQCVLG